MRPVLVAGTGSWKPGVMDWFVPGHAFGKFLTSQGVTPCYDGDQPFVWDTDLNGIFWTGKKDWEASAYALYYFVAKECNAIGKQTAIIAHSHALQVVAFAAQEHDLKIQTLITMGSPIRTDMLTEYAALRANTQYWLHVYSDSTDKWQWLGELGDRANPFAWRVQRMAPLANKNDFVPDVGHSELLRDPQQYHYWIERGWINSLKG